MNRSIYQAFLTIGLLIALLSAVKAQEASDSISNTILARMPLAYRDQAKRLARLTDEDQQYLIKGTEQVANWIIGKLAHTPDGANFLLVQLEKEQSPRLRSQIIRSMREYWQTHPVAQKILEQHIVGDSDADVALRALEVLREIRIGHLHDLLATRPKTEMKTAGPDAAAKLMSDEEYWNSLSSGTMLPSFLRQPPPVFSAKSPRESVRLVAFGDFGNCTKDQNLVAAAIVAYHQKQPFDFGITLGDNFTSDGMHSTSDPRWKTCWEDLYGQMHITFYPSFGNHDWVYHDSPAAEILYSSSSWHMPSPYYTFVAGPVQFFAIDTEVVSKAQEAWLTTSLDQSRARWKVVYGHFPLYYAAPAGTENRKVIATLLPILKGRADVYFAGHYHSLEHLKPVDGLNLFISGGGGRPLYAVDEHSPVALWAAKEFGFTVIEANANQFKVSFVGTNGQSLYSTTLDKQ